MKIWFIYTWEGFSLVPFTSAECILLSLAFLHLNLLEPYTYININLMQFPTPCLLAPWAVLRTSLSRLLGFRCFPSRYAHAKCLRLVSLCNRMWVLHFGEVRVSAVCFRMNSNVVCELRNILA